MGDKLTWARDKEGAHDIEEGEFTYRLKGKVEGASADTGGLVLEMISHISIWPKGCEYPVTLPVRPAGQAREQTPEWELSGPLETPTLMPSVFNEPPTGWHGWIKNGESTLA